MARSVKPERRTASSSTSVKRPRIVIISGLSGAGKTVALRAVEDAGFYCVDNIPAALIGSLISRISQQHGVTTIAIGIDIREKNFLGDFNRTLARLKKKFLVEVLYLEAEPEVLVRRFKETRRPHPLGGDIENAIKTEKEELSVLKNNADRVVDTSTLSPHALRRLVASFYAARAGHKDLAVSLISFGFKYGIPQNIDLLFDVRFLPNPHFIPGLRELTGRDKQVSDYVFSHQVSKRFMKHIKEFLAFLIPQYIREGKTYISIAFGCTGGRHRSPAIVEKVSAFLDQENLERNIIHRDIS